MKKIIKKLLVLGLLSINFLYGMEEIETMNEPITNQAETNNSELQQQLTVEQQSRLEELQKELENLKLIKKYMSNTPEVTPEKSGLPNIVEDNKTTEKDTTQKSNNLDLSQHSERNADEFSSSFSEELEPESRNLAKKKKKKKKKK